MGLWMDIKSKIKSNLKEAELYRGQGLLLESKSKYQETLELIKMHLQPQDGEKIANAISEKIIGLEKEITRVEKKVLSPHMTKESQDLITRMFRASEGEDQNSAAIEGAKALIKFGQFQRARNELEKLIEVDSQRAEAARHIMNCYFLENKPDEAISCYEKWLSNTLFADDQLVVLKKFIEKNLQSKGINKKLPMRSKPVEIGKTGEKGADVSRLIPASPEKAKPATPVQEKKIPTASGKQDSEEFEEFDILASIKKAKKPDGGGKK
jgi:tetratricopeptide (TPR) repeat protein